MVIIPLTLKRLRETHYVKRIGYGFDKCDKINAALRRNPQTQIRKETSARPIMAVATYCTGIINSIPYEIVYTYARGCADELYIAVADKKAYEAIKRTIAVA